MDSAQIEVLEVRFDEMFGDGRPLFCATAPGRVNLIGEHTDYNGGFVLPMAISRATRFLFRPSRDGLVSVWSENYGERDDFDLADITENPGRPWANYPRGVALMLERAGYQAGGMEAVVWGDVPIGAGLSSSASLEVAAVLAFCAAGNCTPPPQELALICQKAENEFVGLNCGIMDQFVALHARRDHAVLLDCRSLEYRLVPLDPSAVRVVVCNTMVHHELGSSAYNERRATCEAAAGSLGCLLKGVRELRDVSPAHLRQHGGSLDALMLKRARHVVTENERTPSAAEALQEGDYERFGELMNASHESLRDDYEVSCAELDLMVELARRRPGTLGARMTGAGFGGCTVNLVRPEACRDFASSVSEAYYRETGKKPEIFEFNAAGPAEVRPC